MADLDPLGLFPNSKMAQAARLGQSRFYSTDPVNPLPVVPTTWSTTDKSNVTLSGGNLVATVPSGSGGVRNASGLSSGKYYWENTYTTLNSNSITVGLARAIAVVDGSNTSGIVFVARITGGITVGAVDSGSALGIIGAGAVIGIAVDLTAKLIWFRVAPTGNWNGSAAANPATGVNGIDIASISTGPLFPWMSGQTGDKVTANFGGSAFSGAVPASFTLGWLT